MQYGFWYKPVLAALLHDTLVLGESVERLMKNIQTGANEPKLELPPPPTPPPPGHMFISLGDPKADLACGFEKHALKLKLCLSRASHHDLLCEPGAHLVRSS